MTKDANIFFGRPSNCGAIIMCCKGKIKTSKGYKWKYAEEDKSINCDTLIELKDFPDYAISEKGDIYNIRRQTYLKLHKN